MLSTAHIQQVSKAHSSFEKRFRNKKLKLKAVGKNVGKIDKPACIEQPLHDGVSCFFNSF